MKDAAFFSQRNRFWLLLPLIVCPFLTLIFWLLGRGSGDVVKAAVENKGLNLQLPDAKVASISALDKLSFYTMAKQDSLKRIELEQLDPNYSTVEDEEVVPVRYDALPYARVYPSTIEVPVVKSNESIDQLQAMVDELQQPRKDPDMEALNQTLQQLVALQEPKVTTTTTVAASAVFEVKPIHSSTSGFYGESGMVADSVNAGLIRAVVHGAQILQEGAVVKLRLLEDVFIHQEKIPAGSFLFGLTTIDKERLQIQIRSIAYQRQYYPVSLIVLDIDGMEGIYIPGSLGREVVKQAAEQSVQSIGILGVDPSLKTQAAAAGIGTVKNLLGRKARLVRVTIQSGYQVFLRDEKRREP